MLAFISATGLDSKIWTTTVDRICQGLVRTTAPFRKRMPRVNSLPGQVIGRMIRWVIPTYPRTVEALDAISAKYLRAVVMITVQFYCLARLSDVRNLRAADMRLTTLENTPAIEIFFRMMKNDQNCTGNMSYIIAEGGNACPYMLIKLYYGRFSFFFNDGQIMDENFLMPKLRMAKVTRTIIADGSSPVSQSTLVANIKELAKIVGFEPAVSGKSAKIGGTSAAFANGLSDADIRDKGRWRTLESALYYRRLAESYKLKLARATSVQTEPWRQAVPDNAQKYTPRV